MIDRRVNRWRGRPARLAVVAVATAVIAAVVAPGWTVAAQAPPDQPTSGPPAAVGEEIARLLEQHGALQEEVVRMRSRIESLARALRESSGATPAVDELGPLISALDSDSYRERLDATAAIRRTLVDRMWLLLETPDLTGEARHRLRTLLVETTAMIRLTTVAADLGPAERDALWNLLDAEPRWVLDALGDEPNEIRAALRQPPPDHDLAAEIVLAALLRDELRPVPQMVALSLIEEATSPLLRHSLQDLISPAYQSRTGRIAGTVFNQREQAAEQAVRILARNPSSELVAFFLAYLRTTRTWSAKIEFSIIDAMVAMRAREATGELVAIAQDKRERLHGGQSYQGLMVKPGDCEIIGAALLLGMDLGELSIRRRPARNDDDPPYYGFEAPRPQESPERKAAFAAVRDAVSEAGPFEPIPGLEEAIKTLSK